MTLVHHFNSERKIIFNCVKCKKKGTDSTIKRQHSKTDKRSKYTDLQPTMRKEAVKQPLFSPSFNKLEKKSNS